MPKDEIRAAINRLNDGFWNQGDFGAIDEVYATDFVDHTPPAGFAPTLDGFKQFATMFRGAFSDLKSTANQIIVEGDRAAWHWTVEGRHTGPLMGIPATGKQVSLSGISIDLFKDGKLSERWTLADMLGLMQQLEVVPSPN